MTIDETRALVLRAHEAFITGDTAMLESALAPDCVLHQCGFLQPLTRDQIGGFLRGGGRALSDPQRWVESVVAEGDMVAIHWRTSGIHTGSRVPEAAGRHVSYDSMTFVRVSGDKIAEIWNIQDTASLRTQLEEFVTAR